LDIKKDYEGLENVDNVYIPVKYFIDAAYEKVLSKIATKFEAYIYLPSILKGEYEKLVSKHLNNTIEKYKVKRNSSIEHIAI